MLAVRVRFDRPLRRVAHDFSKPVAIVEAPRVAVPIPIQPPPRPQPPVVEKPQHVPEEPKWNEEREQAHRDELRAMEERHRQELSSLRDLLKKMTVAAEQGATARKLQVNELQQAAVEIATTVAARLMHREVTEGQFPIEEMVRDMARELDVDAPLTIYLHPEDLTSLRNRIDPGEILPDHAQTIRIAEDDHLPRGSCRLETPETMLLGDLGGQLQTIRDELLRSLGHAAGS